MRFVFRYTLAGAAAGCITGILGAGGGLVLIPLLSSFCREEERRIFPSSLAIMFPICLCSALMQYRAENIPLNGIVVYLLGGSLGGMLAMAVKRRISVSWLRFAFGLILIWSGFRCLFL